MSQRLPDVQAPPNSRPLTRTLPRAATEGALSGFILMAFLLLVTPAGEQSTRVGRLILMGGSASLGGLAGATLAFAYWWYRRFAYKKSGGPMAPLGEAD